METDHKRNSIRQSLGSVFLFAVIVAVGLYGYSFYAEWKACDTISRITENFGVDVGNQEIRNRGMITEDQVMDLVAGYAGEAGVGYYPDSLVTFDESPQTPAGHRLKPFVKGPEGGSEGVARIVGFHMVFEFKAGIRTVEYEHHRYSRIKR